MKLARPQIPRFDRRAAALALALAWAGGLLVGCADDTPVPADRIEIHAGNDQAGLPGETLHPMVVRVLGPSPLDFLGRKRDRLPAAGVRVIFEIEDPRTKKVPTLGSSDGVPTEPSPDSPPPGSEAGEAGATQDGSTLGRTLADSAAGGALAPFPLLLPVIPKAGEAPGRAEAEAGRLRLEVETDSEGLASALVRLGSRNGRWNVEARIAENEKEKVRFRTVTGVEREPGPLEGVVGERIPLRLRLMTMPDPKRPERLEPMADREILFRIVGTPEAGRTKAEIRDKRNETNSEGIRDAELDLGDTAGVYNVVAEIQTEPEDEPFPVIDFTVVAVDWVRTGLLLLSGVFVFLIGVRLLGNGFLLVTSRYIHLPTDTWARNRFQGYLGGILSGVIFESSSLVLSYLVSFANGGLLTAAGGLGLVLGANLGGTILPQLLARGVAWLAVPFLAAGIVLLLAPRRVRLISWGWVFLGAGLILTGWGLLEESASLAALSQKLRGILGSHAIDAGLAYTVYLPRFLTYLVLAALVAFLLRTSNLVVVLTMAFAAVNVVGVPTAIPMVIGANLGSAVRVLAFSLRKRREARRLALANALVLVAGTLGIVALSLIVVDGHSVFAWLVEWLTPGRGLTVHASTGAQHLAVAHTLFNLLCGLPFLIVPAQLFGAVDRILPPAPATASVKPYILDRNLVTVPALALRQATEEAIYMTEMCRKTVAEAFDSFRYSDLDLSEHVVRREEVIAEIHREISQYLVEVAENQLSRHDASQLEILQIAVSSLERIGSLGERYRDLTSRKIEEKVQAAEEVDGELNDVYDLTMGQFSNILTLLRERDTKTEENAVKVIERLAKLSSRVESLWRQRIEQAESTLSPLEVHLQTVIYQEAFGTLFRIASHLAHIAEKMRILSPERF